MKNINLILFISFFTIFSWGGQKELQTQIQNNQKRLEFMDKYIPRQKYQTQINEKFFPIYPERGMNFFTKQISPVYNEIGFGPKDIPTLEDPEKKLDAVSMLRRLAEKRCETTPNLILPGTRFNNLKECQKFQDQLSKFLDSYDFDPAHYNYEKDPEKRYTSKKMNFDNHVITKHGGVFTDVREKALLEKLFTR
jgi:hypothetical protein